MTNPATPEFEPGRGYRTRDLQKWGANPTRLAHRLVREGKLHQVAHGLFYAPKQSRFGPVPASDEALLRAFFGDDPFVITGPPRWNALGLGSTAMFAATLVYNIRRTGEFKFGNRTFLFRRVRFPIEPAAEWFVVDLLQHHTMAGVSLTELKDRLVAALRVDRFDASRLRAMAQEYGTKATAALVEQAVLAADV